MLCRRGTRLSAPDRSPLRIRPRRTPAPPFGAPCDQTELGEDPEAARRRPRARAGGRRCPASASRRRPPPLGLAGLAQAGRRRRRASREASCSSSAASANSRSASVQSAVQEAGLARRHDAARERASSRARAAGRRGRRARSAPASSGARARASRSRSSARPPSASRQQPAQRLGAAARAGDPRRAAVEAGEAGGAAGQRRPARGVGADREHPGAAGDQLGDRHGGRAAARDDRAPRSASLGRHVDTIGGSRRARAELGLEAPPPLRFLASQACERRRLRSASAQRVELAQDDARLDRAVPVVDLEPHRGVDRVLVLDAEAGAAEGDAEGAVGAAVEAEAGVLALPHRPHVADPGRGDHQPHARVAHPERGQLPQLLGQLEPEPDAADHRVDPLGPAQVLGAEHRGRVGGERLAEGLEVLGPQREPGGGAVPAEARPGARRRPRAPPSRSKPGMLRPDPRPPPSPSSEITTTGRWWRSTRREATIPTTPGCQPSPATTSPGASRSSLRQLPPRRLGGRVDLALGRPPLRVGPAQLLGDLLRPRLVVGQQQLDPGIGPVEPPRGVDPRRQPERQVALVEPRRLAFRQPRSAPAAPAAAPAASPPARASPAPGSRRPAAPRRRPSPGRRGRDPRSPSRTPPAARRPASRRRRSRRASSKG